MKRPIRALIQSAFRKQKANQTKASEHPLNALHPAQTCKAIFSGWLFENPYTTTPLNVYRTIEIDLGEIDYLDEKKRHCSNR